MNVEQQKPNPVAPWYANGLQFKCSQCGNCCTGAPGVVWVTEEEVEQIAKSLDRSVGEVRLFHTRLVHRKLSLTEHTNGDCTFFDQKSRRCTIYDARPLQCRTWPFWNSNLESKAAWDEAAVDCPGMRHGNFVNLQDIENLASQIDV
ncbi:MAG: YkgJ family cysteine cluster protein [Planctomycetota bacterium]|nr:YkgJ family cysteine cluster protein [Planctomycetota bacterium]